MENETKLDASVGLLLSAIRDPRFLVGFVVAVSTLARTLNPSRALQKLDGDLVSTCALIREIEYLFANFRADAEKHFPSVFKRAKDLLVEVDSAHDDVPVSRVCARQTQRAIAEEYYRRSVYVPFFGQVIGELKSRFDDFTVRMALRFNELLMGSKADMDDILEADQYTRTALSHWCSCGRKYIDGQVPLQSLRLSSTQRNMPIFTCNQTLQIS